MDIENVREYCLSKKGTEEGMPFDDTSLVIKVMGKMFVLINLNGNDIVCMKCDPEYALELREKYNGINGAYHFNKKYWNQVSLSSDVGEPLIKQLIDHSYEEVIKKFTKKLRAEYDALP